ncbi:MAG: class I SAM-dependent methyltransferase [Propionibacteriaceae bacterium]|jgi:SAM-dependent methyltransferase|nr:class I SAM-dependent methyltransferase [Propionibacteriaceae bacterium]
MPGWSHNAYYHQLLLDLLPVRSQRILDVGCGTGAFAAKLAGRAERVDAVDCSEAMINQARSRTPVNVNCVLADVLEDPLPGRNYDVIVSLSALHHLSLERALPILATALRPGGRLVAIALPRPDIPRELPVEVAAAVGYRLLGAVFSARRALGRPDGFAQDSADSMMPVVIDPSLTTRQVAAQAAQLLPGARVRRLLFWRYLLTWEKPS